jgi:dTDP-4-amino-4,6-dideoxygalactose transaminase
LYAAIVEENKRDFIIEQARLNGIVLGVHYPVPVHMQPAYMNRLVVATQMEKTVNLSKCVVSLPMYPELKINQIEKVCSFITKCI